MRATSSGWLAIVMMAGCAGKTASPVLAAPVAPAAAEVAPVDAGAIAIAADAAVVAPVAAACHPSLAALLPADPRLDTTVFYRDGASIKSGAYKECDALGKIVLWADAKQIPTRDPRESKLTGDLLMIDRAHPERVARAPYDKGSGCSDECSGPGGGFAGCSERGGCTIQSKLVGGGLHVGAEDTAFMAGDDWHACGRQAHGYARGFCSSASWLAVLDRDACDQGSRLTLALFSDHTERDDEPASLAGGDLIAAESHGTAWAYRFPAVSGHAVILRVDVGGAPAASLEVDGKREDCIAFQLRPE